jgi:hypothetical protein
LAHPAHAKPTGLELTGELGDDIPTARRGGQLEGASERAVHVVRAVCPIVALYTLLRDASRRFI